MVLRHFPEDPEAIAADGSLHGTLPEFRAGRMPYSLGRYPFTFQNGAAWRLNLISRPDKRRERPLVSVDADSISLSSEPNAVRGASAAYCCA